MNKKEMPKKTKAIIVGLLALAAMVIFIVFLMDKTSLWKSRLFILYGFLFVGGLTCGFIGEKNNYAILVGFLTYGFFRVAEVLMNLKPNTVWRWILPLVIMGIGFMIGGLYLEKWRKKRVE